MEDFSLSTRIDQKSKKIQKMTVADKLVLRRLMANSGVFYWRQGHWHHRSDTNGKSKKLAPRMLEIFLQLKSAGQVTEEMPGYFRLAGAANRPLQNDEESPLGRLSLLRTPEGKPYIDQIELAAGEKLRRDFERAALSARTTASYDATTVSGGQHWQTSDNAMARLSDNTIDARQRLHLALEAVGPELASILYHVCCLAGGIEQAELRLAMPRRTGKIVLALALTRLARHYGLKKNLRHGGPGQIGHWSLADFKPAILPPQQHQV